MTREEFLKKYGSGGQNHSNSRVARTNSGRMSRGEFMSKYGSGLGKPTSVINKDQTVRDVVADLTGGQDKKTEQKNTEQNPPEKTMGRFTQTDILRAASDTGGEMLNQLFPQLAEQTEQRFQEIKDQRRQKREDGALYGYSPEDKETIEATTPQYTAKELLQAASEGSGAQYKDLRQRAQIRTAQTQAVQKFELGKTDAELLDAYAAAGVKLNEAELPTAKRLVKEFEAKYPKAQGYDPINGMDTQAAYQMSAMMNDPQYQSYLQLLNKTDAFEATLTNFTEGTGAGQVLNLLGRIGADEGDQAEMDAWKDARGAVRASGQAQHPIASTVGYMGGKMTEYLAGKIAMGALPGVGGALNQAGNAISRGLGGAGKVGAAAAQLLPGERIAGLMGDQILDVLFDTAPQVAEDVQQMQRQQREGLADGEEEITPGSIALGAAGNFGSNVLFNLLGEAGEIVKDAKGVPDAIQMSGARQAVASGAAPSADQLLDFNQGATHSGLEGSQEWLDTNMAQYKNGLAEGAEAKSAAQAAEPDLYFETGENGPVLRSRALDAQKISGLDGTLKTEYNGGRGDLNGTDVGAGAGGIEPGGAGGSDFRVQSGSEPAGNQRVFRQPVSGSKGGTYDEFGGTEAIRGVAEDTLPMGQRMGLEDGRRGQAAGGDQVLRGFLNADENLNNAVARTGATPLELTDTTGDPQLFSSALEQARQMNPHGLMVSGKSVEELTQPGTVTFMSRDGLAGALVTGDGDIEAVFKNPQSSAKGAGSSLLLNAVNNGGTKLDCYGEDLVALYNKHGFEPVARVKWNPEYAPEGWTYGPKDVYVMKLADGIGIEEITERLGRSEADGGFHRWTREELESLPVMDYDEALTYRDSLIKQGGTAKQVVDPFQEGKTFLDGQMGGPSVGAKQADPKSYSYMQNTYGTIAPGENAARVVDAPVSTDGTDRVGRYARTAMEAKSTPDEMVKTYEEYVEDGLFSHDIKRDKAALDNAVKSITKNGYDGALNRWQEVVGGLRPASKEDIVLAQMLYAEAAKAGDTDTAMKLVAEIAAEGTRYGQNVQALRLLKKLTPEGQLYYVQKVVDGLNQDIKSGKHVGIGISRSARQSIQDGAKQLTISDGLAKQLLEATTPKEITAAANAIYQDIGRQLPTDWATKWNAWRYLSMLGNPRTHWRNILGNVIFYPARKIKDTLATGLEHTFIKDAAQRTKAVLNPLSDADQALKSFAKQDFDVNMRDVVQGGGKMNPENVIRDSQTVFTSPLMQPIEAARKFNGKALDAEDALFSRFAYTDSMAGYMKARGLKPEDMTGRVLEQARSYAIEQAQKATFRDASKVASALNQFTNTNAATRVIGGALFPFTKTPMNIMKRGFEYSPMGLLKSAAELIDVKNGTKALSQVMDSLAAGLTGTGAMILGMWMAHEGWLTGKSADGKKEANFEDLTGRQEYAVNLFGGSYTLDWAAPISLPVFVGVELEKWRENGEFDFGAVVDAMTSITDPMINMTMLQGINNAIKAAAYGDNALGDLAMNAATGYVSQAIPTLFGQVARAVDDTRRATYTEPGQPMSGLSRTLQKTANKIPGLSTYSQPYVDQWGRTEENPGGSFAMRLLYNTLSPGYWEKDKTTPTDSILNQLYQDTGESSVLPGYASKTWSENGVKHNFTAEEYTEYSQARGRASYNILEQLAPKYDELDSEQAVYATNRAYSIANELAQNIVVGKELPKSTAEVLKAAEDFGGGVAGLADILFAAAVVKDVEGDKYPNGKTITGSVKRHKIEALVEAGYSRSEAMQLYELIG